MDVAVPRYVVKAQHLSHLSARAASSSAVRHRQGRRHAERREDHVLSTAAATDLLVEVNGELAIGSDRSTLVTRRTEVPYGHVSVLSEWQSRCHDDCRQ